MKTFFLLLLTLILGCGPSIFEAPPLPPEFEDCTIAEKDFATLILKSLTPLPFTGRRSITLHTDKPEYWKEFKGTIHLRRINWNVDWLSDVQVIFGPFVIASWDGHDWELSSTVDLKPFFRISEADSDRLKFKVELSATGIKPRKEFLIEVKAEFYFCGENNELMSEI